MGEAQKREREKNKAKQIAALKHQKKKKKEQNINHLIDHLKIYKNLIKGKVTTWEAGCFGTLITADGFKFYFQASGTGVAPNSILPGLVVVFYGIQKKPFHWQKNTLPIAFGVYAYETEMDKKYNFTI